MKRPLRLLLVEDVERDARLVVLHLQRGGFDVSFERVDTAEAMAAALARQEWDLIISDYSMPAFSAPAALALLEQHRIDLPFIIVSDSIGEETAVAAMRAGAHDFMAKGQFARLVPAVERELRDAALRIERTKMQNQLLIADRMASVGTLAAGVAHEINNPLAALIANLDFATQDLIAQQKHELLPPLQDAQECAERIRLIVRDLKVFSRSDEEARGPVDVQRVLESSLRMAWNEIRHRARLVKDYGDVPPVDGNEARLGQVFLNLIVNATQSIEEGAAEDNEIRIVTRRGADGGVVVEVRDTGCGIPESALPRIFDPFFSTKPIGVGTGLGLAICHRIITALGGQITLETRVGVGTVFRTSLPASVSDQARTLTAPAASVPGGKARVLVVDDEPLMGSAIRRALSSEHDVVVVKGAREALGLLSSGERYDAILCDLMMPEMTGMDLHAELVRTGSSLAGRMIFMTGGAFTARAREFLDEVSNPRLDKPLDFKAVKATLRALVR